MVEASDGGAGEGDAGGEGEGEGVEEGVVDAAENGEDVMMVLCLSRRHATKTSLPPYLDLVGEPC